MIRHLLFGFSLCAGAAGQPAFEAASIKPVDPGPCPVCWRGNGGPGTSDPGRVFRSTSLRGLIVEAYNLQLYQFIGPGWTEDQRFELTAALQRGTTSAHYHEMLQRFLAERFHLVVHRETRQLPVYQLVVGKGGSKLQVPVPDPPPGDDAHPLSDGFAKLEHDAEGYPILGPGVTMAGTSSAKGPRARARQHNQPVSKLVDLLAGQLNTPVVDRTGLTGNFDWTLSWGRTQPSDDSRALEDSAPNLFEALERQLGLKLEGAKGPVDCVVFDSANRMPAEN